MIKKEDEVDTCRWVWDEATEAYETDCGELFQFMTDGPIENGMRYCCYCGKPIEAKGDIDNS